MMPIGGEQQRHAEDGEEVADQHTLLPLGRIDGGDEAEAELLGDHRARHRERRQRDARGRAEHDADGDFVHHHYAERAHRAQVDLVGGPVQRQDDQRQQQRDRQLDAHRDVALAESRQQHHHRAHAGEHQHEGGGKGRQQRYVDAHSSTMHQPPMIRDDIRIMWLCIESAMNGKASKSVTNIARIFARRSASVPGSGSAPETARPRRRPRARSPSGGMTPPRWSRSHRAPRRGFQHRSLSTLACLRFHRHCEGCEASTRSIESRGAMDCFAAFALTTGMHDQQSSDRHLHDVFVGLDHPVAYRHQRRDRHVGLRDRRHHVHDIGLA